mmetsp:Transcript_12429/g.23636  ORF Transcript_12429/g.23636 Transcript_12429/m.23636 type:complete len:216 (+) Transcript_12429:1287-1934(+)
MARPLRQRRRTLPSAVGRTHQSEARRRGRGDSRPHFPVHSTERVDTCFVGAARHWHELQIRGNGGLREQAYPLVAAALQSYDRAIRAQTPPPAKATSPGRSVDQGVEIKESRTQEDSSSVDQRLEDTEPRKHHSSGLGRAQMDHQMEDAPTRRSLPRVASWRRRHCRVLRHQQDTEVRRRGRREAVCLRGNAEHNSQAGTVVAAVPLGFGICYAR